MWCDIYFQKVWGLSPQKITCLKNNELNILVLIIPRVWGLVPKLQRYHVPQDWWCELENTIYPSIHNKKINVITTLLDLANIEATHTLSTLSSSEWQEDCNVTSATFPAWLTMNTFIAWDTWRPVSTAVFITSQFWYKTININKLWYIQISKVILKF